MNQLTIEGLGGQSPLSRGETRKSEGPDDFGKKFKEALAEANTLQKEADQAMTQVTRGEMGIHEGMLKITEADLSLRLLVQVRNKIMDAYREISRM